MPSSVDLDNLESDITGMFLDYLSNGGIDTKDLESLSKIKHNTFESALIYIYNNLFKPDKTLINNQLSLLPYDDNNILKRLADIYINLCSICSKSTGIQGFLKLTGFASSTVYVWMNDELNPERMEILQNLHKNNQHILINRLQDTPLGSVAVANNSEEVGLMWSRNNQPLQINNNAYLIPGENVKQKLLDEMPAEITKNG